MLKNALPQIIKSSPGRQVVSGQCDCACESQSYAPAPAEIKPRRPVQTCFSHPELQFVPLEASRDFVAAFVPSGSGIALINTPVRELLGSVQSPRSLFSLRAMCQERWGQDSISILDTLLALGLLTDGSPFVPNDKVNSLAAWIHVINACNLRCRYCYVRKGAETMTVETGRAAIDALIRSALVQDLCAIKLKFAGGEPTLALPLVIDVYEYALEMVQAHGIQLQGVVLSNGVDLTNSIIETLLDHNLRLMISLDSLRGCGQRVTSDGSDVSIRVTESIERALTLGLIPDVSVTVTNHTLDTLPELVAWLLERNLPFNLNFYRKNEVSPSHPDLVLDIERLVSGMQPVLATIQKNLPPRSLLGTLADRADLSRPHSHTCAVGRNYVVIDHLGRVAKCQMQINQPVTTIQADDCLARIQADRDGVKNLPVDAKQVCRQCAWRYWCAGGCPLMAYRATGRYDTKSPYCEAYQALFPQIVRLEGQRLFQYADGQERIPNLDHPPL